MIGLIITLITGTTIIFDTFSYCGDTDGKHWVHREYGEIVSTHIEICKNLSKEKKEFTILHELGHEYWFVYMTKEERIQYQVLFEKSKNKDFYRDYSMTSAHEDFADNFALVIQDKKLERGKVFYDKIDFIKKTFK